MSTSPLILDQYTPYRLAVASSAVSMLVATTYQQHFGIKIPEWRLIAVLFEDGPTTQQNLVPRTGMDKVTISRAAQTLTKKKLIKRTPHEFDGRSHHLMLTENGLALYAQVAPMAKACEQSLLGVLEGAEVGELRMLLLRLEHNAKRILGEEIV